MKRIVGIIIVGLIAGQLLHGIDSAAAAPTVLPERDWVEVTKATHPPANGALVFDSTRNENVLFVPAVKNGRAAQTWTFNGSTRSWTKKNPAHTPLLYGAVSAYDADRQQVVLVGPAPEEEFCDIASGNETWTWNGSDWTQQAPSTPLIGCPFNADFHPAGHKVVAITGNGVSSDSWTWNGTDWAKASTDSTPAYLGMATATDPVSGGVLAFGGDFFWHGHNDSSITFQWNGATWTNVNGGGGVGDPEPRTAPSMTYDSTLGALILFGGKQMQSSTLYNDTFRWDGSRWTRIGTAHRPPAMTSTALADNPTSGAVLFDGARTWVFTARVATSGGYAATNWAGHVATAGEIAKRGDLAGKRLTKPVVGIARTPSRQGYWLVAGDGGIFTFGDARFYGSTGAKKLNQPIVGMASTPSGQGYWLVAADGGIFTFGDARFYGSTGGKRLNKPVIAMASTPSGNGYRLLASDGGIFTFGDARFFGSTGAQKLNKPIVGLASTPSGAGYWLVAADGGIFTFGDAAFRGAVPGRNTIVAIASTPSGNGYHLFANNGTVQHFGDAPNLGNLAITFAIAGAGA